MAFPRFDRKRLKILPLSQREHDMDLSYLLDLDAAVPDFEHPALPVIAEQIVATPLKLAICVILLLDKGAIFLEIKSTTPEFCNA